MSATHQPDTNALLKLADERMSDSRLLVAFSDNKYLDVLLNWLIAIHRLGIRNYLVVSLDETIHAFLVERAFPSVLIKMDGPLRNLWRLRLVILRELCAHGVDVIHSDIDAIWLRDPIPEYFSRDADHLVISQGTVWPEDVLRRQGFVLCCGLFYLRSNNATLSLLDDLLHDIATTNDDQISLNRLINASVTWDKQLTNPYQFAFQGHRVLCSEAPIRGRCRKTGLTVTLLPHHLFQRVHMPHSPAFVNHLFCDKTKQDKIDTFRKTGCLFLHENWKNIEFDADTIERLDVRA
jgi:hypothetical protein